MSTLQRSRRRAQAIVLIAGMLTATLMAVGLAVDAGQLYTGKRTAQEAADAAAFAGASVLYQGGTIGEATAAAFADARLNGFWTNMPTSGTTVEVAIPPTSGPFLGDDDYVEVIIRTPVRTSLLPQQFTTVRSRGVAGNVSKNKGYAIMALDQTCTNGVAAVSSNGTLAVAGGGIQVNSCSGSAAQNSGTVTLEAGYYTDVVGGASGGWPNLRTGRPIQPDPFAGIAKPSTNGLPTYTPVCAPLINLPGVYTSTFNGNCDYKFAPGTYIFKGGGISLAGNSSACTGVTPCGTADGGVFFFLTNSNYPSTGGSCATLSLHGNNETNLSAPTSGTYEGMLIWQDNVCTNELSIGGNGAINSTGTIYAPAATVAGNGNNSLVNVSQVVAKKVDTQNANFQVSYSTSATWQGYVPALVE